MDKARAAGMASGYVEAGVSTLNGLVDTVNTYAEMIDTAIANGDQGDFDLALEIYTAVIGRRYQLLGGA